MCLSRSGRAGLGGAGRGVPGAILAVPDRVSVLCCCRARGAAVQHHEGTPINNLNAFYLISEP